MNIGLIASAATAVFIAVASYLGTYVNNRFAVKRNARLARLDSQLRDLYGPLAALLLATDALYGTWRRRQLPVPGGWKNSNDEEREEWRHWMRTVFMPLNRRMSQIVTTHADLIAEDHMPPELIALCAHVESYEALLARWEVGRFERYVPHILFPDVVIKHAIDHFNVLKSEQTRLLGRRTRLRGRKANAPVQPSGMAAWHQFKEKYEHEYFRDAQLDEESQFSESQYRPGRAGQRRRSRTLRAR